MDHPTVIITGASHGIGAASARLAAAKGAKVVLTARNRADLEREKDFIMRSGGTALVVSGDISRRSVCQEIVRRTLKVFGRIDAVINNAGVIGPLGLVSDLRSDEWVRTLEVNLFGPVLLCHEAIPYLRETEGRIVNISSAAAVLAIPGGSAYCTSKAAINHFTKILSLEESSITVIALNPGDVNTPMQAEIRAKGNVKAFEEVHQFAVSLYETGQLLPPEQAARCAVALALAAPREWTGEFIHHDEERLQNLINAGE